MPSNSAPANTLATAWTFPGKYGPQQGNAPLVMAGDRVVGFAQSTVYAINLYTGAEISNPNGFPFFVQRANPDDTSPVPIVSSNGAVFFPAADQNGNNVLQALRLVDGSPLPATAWTAPAIGALLSITAIDDLVMVVQQDASGNTLVSAVRATDGGTAWGPLTVTNLTSGAVGYGDHAIFFVAGRQLYAVNTDFGDTRFPRPPANGAVAPAYNINQQTAPLVGQGVVVCAGDHVWGFDAKSGAQRWAFQPAGDSFNGATPVALSPDGRIVAALSDKYVLSVLDTLTGTVTWSQPVGYAGTPVIAGDRVFVTGSAQTTTASFDLATGGDTTTYVLGRPNRTDLGVSQTPPSIGNGNFFVQMNDGSVLAKPYGSQSAAYFDGQASHIDIAAEGKQFDFETGDFTIEAWVKSSEGGEILCGYPTVAGADSAGFRVNLGPEGQLRFAVTDLDGTNQDLAQGLPTPATDGFWHHIAVVRSGGDISFFTDGIASKPASLLTRGGKSVHANGYALDAKGRARRDTLVPPPPPAPIAITGQNKLFIGWDYYGVTDGTGDVDHLVGLVREVRLWNKALDAAALQSRMNKVLGPKGAPAGGDPRKKANEPQLLGNWHLDETYDTDQAVAIENDVLGHEYVATFNKAAALITDLDLDMSAFPYLLDQVTLQWPYAGFWSTRGEHDLSTPPALSDDGILCFGTNNALYGVRRLDGARQWGYATPGHSAPLALGKSFYAFTAERGLEAIVAATGTVTEVEAFSALPKAINAGQHLPAPAASGSTLAAGAQDGTVLVANPGSASATPIRFATDRFPGDLQYDGGKVCCIAGVPSARKLFICDTATKQIASQPVDSENFTICGSRVFFTQGGQLVGLDTAKNPSDPGARPVATVVSGSQVTGLAASSDGAILIVSTNSGRIYGLSLATLAQRWRTAIPEGSASGPATQKGYLNAPTIAGRSAFCASRSGAVVALDVPSGRIMGLFFEPTAIMTPVLVQAGTAFFGCAPASPTAALDGALHSVVFGETVALRTGVDASDKAAPLGYADIVNDQPIFAGDNGECCVEAWINAWPGDKTGGEILSVRPAKSGNFGARLILGDDGRIKFIGHDKKTDGTWEGFGTQTLHPTAAHDGQWHHIAASRAGAQDIRIYFDGKQQDVDAVAPDPLTAAGIADKFEVRIGAPAYQAQPTADNCFRGMIAEARLWETYLPADQISKRMHTKLRGDEFSLTAYWDFDTSGVHDGSRNGHDGTLTGGTSFSLCDLTFELPDYPDVATAAKITQIGEALVPGATPNAFNNTIYELTLSCTKADKSPLPNAMLRLWYVKHPGEQQPDQITLSTAGTNPDGEPEPKVVPCKSMAAVLPDQESTAASFVVYTDDKGQAVIQVATPDRDHGPSLDLSADFMPANERFHVNVLIDNQSLAKPAPAKLTVQTKLIQDYHYSTGSKIDDTRSRETYRAIISALNGDGTPRVGEWLEISAVGYTTIEVGDRSYSINPHNSNAFRTDANGQLTIVVAATDLKTADLTVWAGFMHQGDRVTIALDQDAHASLASVQGGAMKDPNRLVNWKPAKPDGTDGSTRGPLLKGGYENHADDVAGAIRHVASSTQPSPHSSASPAALGAAMDTDRFLDMRAPVRPPLGDQGQALRTLKHVARRAPVTPESVLASIQKVSPGSVGFFIGLGDDAASMSFGHFSAADAAAHMGQPTAVKHGVAHGDMALGGFFSHIWHAVTHAVESVADDIASAAKKIAIEISDTVTVAIHYVDSVVHMVISSIKDAMEIIGNFLAKLALMIVDMIKFLLFLFDWKAILETHRILKDVMLKSLAHLLDGGKIADSVIHVIGEIASKLPGADEIKAQFQSSDARSNPQDRVATAPGQPRDYSQASGVPGTMTFSKMKDYRDAAGTAVGSVASAASPHALLSLMTGLVTKPPGDIGHEFLDFVDEVGRDMKAEAKQELTSLLGMAQSALRPGALDAPIHIPFLSELYKWITGDDLTVLDVSCLVLAVPVNLLYGVISGLRHFNEDARGLPGQISSASTASALHSAMRPLTLGADGDVMEEPIPFSPVTEALIVTVRVFYALVSTGMDAEFAATAGVDNQATKYLRVLKSLLSLSGTLLTQLSLMPRMTNWLAREGFPVDPTVARISTYGGLVIGSIGDVGVLASIAFRGIVPAAVPAAGEDDGQDDVDKGLFAFHVTKATLLPLVTIMLIFSTTLATKEGSAQAPKAAYWLLQISNMLFNFGKFDDFLYTRTGFRAVDEDEEVYENSVKAHLALQLLSAATQFAAATVLTVADE